MKYQKIAINGAKWTTSSTAILTILQFTQVTVLARILTPTEFGLVGMVTILINLFTIFSDMGVSNAIIYKQEEDPKKLSSLYWLNIFFGVLLCLIMILSTPLITSYYNEPKLKDIILISSVIFLINPLGQQFQFLLQKNFEFKLIGIIEIIAALCGTVVAIILALNNFKEASIIFGQIANSLTKTIFLFIVGYRKWKPGFYFNYKEIKEHLRFGIYSVGDNVLNFFSSNLDYIIIGGVLGAKALGFYTLAYQLVIFPISKLNPIITKVAFPLFSTMNRNKENLRKGYLNILDIVSSINFPLLVGLLVTSDYLVLALYGDGWDVTIQLIKLLCIVGILRSLGNPIGSLLMSQGRTDLGFKLNLITLILQIPSLYIGAKVFGIYGVAIGFIIVQIFNIILNFYTVNIIIGQWINKLWNKIYMQLVISISMGIAVYLVGEYVLRELKSHTIICLLIQIPLGIIMYTFLYLMLKKDNLKQLKVYTSK